MSPGLRALRDNHIYYSVRRFPSLSHGLYLTNQFRPCVADCHCEWTGVAKRQHDGRRVVSEYAIQQFRVVRETPGDESAADTCIACAGPFAFDPATVPIT